MKLIIALFLIAFVSANLIVKHFGVYGLWVSSFLLIPFDFICRCIIHEKLSGFKLLATLFILTMLAATITILINPNSVQIALASIAGFTVAQVTAGVMYQVSLAEKKSYFIKVNVSDLVAIIFDSIVFQWVAFSVINPGVTLGQIGIKFAGGLLWYWIFFKVIKIQNKINPPLYKKSLLEPGLKAFKQMLDAKEASGKFRNRK